MNVLDLVLLGVLQYLQVVPYCLVVVPYLEASSEMEDCCGHEQDLDLRMSRLDLVLQKMDCLVLSWQGIACH